MRALTFPVVIALALIVTGCSRSDSEPAAAPPVSRDVATGNAAAAPPSRAGMPRIVFLGDSLTAGLGLQPEQSIPSLIQAQLDAEGYRYEVINAGVSGDTSAGGLRRLEWSLEGPVELLVIELGANDGLRGLPVAQMKSNLAQIIQTARRRGIRVLLTGMEAPPNYGAAYTGEFRGVFTELAREQNVPLMPFFLDGVAGNPTLNQGDGIHPNPAGARVIQGTIWKAIEPLIEKRDS